jgi:hypothetical protein
MALMQFNYKVKDFKGNIFNISLWKNNLKDVAKYLIENGLIIVEDLNTPEYLFKKVGKEE